MKDNSYFDKAKIRLIFETEKEFTAGLSEGDRFAYYMSRLNFVKYSLGKENRLMSDCSGSVCLGLLLATGCSIRVTADYLYRKFFTEKTGGEGDIKAAFFISAYNQNLGGSFYKAGVVSHVAGFAGKDVVLNCVEPRAYLRSFSGMIKDYADRGFICEVRYLNRRALQEASDLNHDLFGADDEFLYYRDLMTENRKGIVYEEKV
ncbi:MAG: hypothetical protein MJ196_12160 [Treponemataceae bacterium]|nr:hypothetical protein [Treponemataceae bacterium]